MLIKWQLYQVAYILVSNPTTKNILKHLYAAYFNLSVGKQNANKNCSQE